MSGPTDYPAARYFEMRRSAFKMKVGVLKKVYRNQRHKWRAGRDKDGHPDFWEISLIL
jgi:hypothetical protein